MTTWDDKLKLPSSVEEARSALDMAYDLIVRADEILQERGTGSPGADSPAELRIDGGQATLSWLEAESDFDGGYTTETVTGSFPARLLVMSPEAIMEWAAAEKAEAKRKSDADHKEYLKQRKIQEEQHERAVFAALKAKYEGK